MLKVFPVILKTLSAPCGKVIRSNMVRVLCMFSLLGKNFSSDNLKYFLFIFPRK